MGFFVGTILFRALNDFGLTLFYPVFLDDELFGEAISGLLFN